MAAATDDGFIDCGIAVSRTSAFRRALAAVFASLIFTGALFTFSGIGSAVTVGPGVVFRPSDSWANISFASTQTFNTITVDSTGVTFDGVRFGVQKYPQSPPRVEITMNMWTPLQTTANATSIRFTGTAATGSNVYFNFTYLFTNREYFLQVDGLEQARKFTTASGHISFPWSTWSTHDFNVLLGSGSGAPPNNCPTKPVVQGTPPITTFIGSSVTLVGSSSDPDGDPLGWSWTWDDGTTTQQSTPPGASQSIADHSWPSAGSYNVTVSVTDAVCVVTSKPFEIDVIPRPAQIGHIAGTVRDAVSNVSLAGANIRVSPGGFAQATDVRGGYNVTVPIGAFSVSASASLYASASRPIVVVSENTTTFVDFDLSPLPANVTAAFDFTVDGATVRFTDRSTTDGSLPISTHLWALGDGTAATDASPTHTYAISALWATYRVTLMACDSADHCGSTSTDITLTNWPVLLVVVGLAVGLAFIGIAVLIWWLGRWEQKDTGQPPSEEPGL